MTKSNLISGGIALFACLVLGHLINKEGLMGPAAWGALTSLFILLFTYIYLGMPGVTQRIRLWCAATPIRGFLLPFPIFVAYLIYYLSTGENQPKHIGYMALYLLIPTILIIMVPKGLQKITLWDLLFVAAIWAPIDFLLIQEAWHWPKAQGASAFLNTSAICLTVMLAVCLRGLEGVGYTFSLRKSDFKIMNLNLQLATLCVIPAAFAVGFVRWAPVNIDVLHILGTFGGIMLAVAIPEELFFRGIIQNLLEKSISNDKIAIAIASIIFGVGHINNQAYPGGPVPDFSYVVFASIAGCFYGLCYKQCGNRIFPAAIIHGIMDTAWIHLFRG